MGNRAARASSRSGDLSAIVTLAAGLFAFWVLLSGLYDAFHLGAGAVAATAIACGTRGIWRTAGGTRTLSRLRIRPAWVPYLAWLLGEIVISGIRVARVVLTPKLRLSPGIVRFRDGLPDSAARTVLAHSITLTPGTVTLDSENGELTVHALDEHSGASLRSSRQPLRARVARLFPPD